VLSSSLVFITDELTAATVIVGVMIGVEIEV
jgi:hypothetical protein